MVSVPALKILMFRAVAQPSSSSAASFEKLPRRNASDLSTEEFDAVYLDRIPVVLTGTTACPPGLNFSSICDGGICQGKVPVEYVHGADTAGRWGGLSDGDEHGRGHYVDFAEWAREMRHDTSDPQYMFDVPMAEVCPALLGDVALPPHLTDAFASQYVYQTVREEVPPGGGGATADPPRDLCAELPCYNMYLAEDGFWSEMHIDAGHSAFVASMCEGEKLWRIVSPAGYSSPAGYESMGTGGGEGNDVGREVDGMYVMGEVRVPFGTWDGGFDSVPEGVTVYEGVTGPGEVLYIPAGAPHAAKTIGRSIMVASNDRTLQNVADSVAYCEEVSDEHPMCSEMRRLYKTVKRNGMAPPNGKNREATNLMAGCEKTYKLLLDSVLTEHKWTALTPENFNDQISKGPMVVMRSQASCGSCFHFIDRWLEITRGLHSPVRLGVLNCFQGRCRIGTDPAYRRLVEVVLAGSLPLDFVFVSPSGGPGLFSWSRYHGSLLLDGVRVWTGVHTGSTIIMESWSRKVLLVVFHLFVHYGMILVDLIGSAGLGILLAFIGVTFLLLSLLLPRRHKKKRKMR